MDDEQSKVVSRSTMQSHDKGISVIGMHIKSENQSSYLPYSYHYNILYKRQICYLVLIVIYTACSLNTLLVSVLPVQYLQQLPASLSHPRKQFTF
jgi:hypothetical protein